MVVSCLETVSYKPLIVAESYDPAFGARPLRRYIQHLSLIHIFFSFASTANAVEVKFSDFITLVKEDKVEEVKLESNKYTFTLKKEAQRGWLTEYYAEDKDVDPAKAEMPTLYTAPLNYTDLALLFDQHKVVYYTPYQSDSAITNLDVYKRQLLAPWK